MFPVSGRDYSSKNFLFSLYATLTLTPLFRLFESGKVVPVVYGKTYAFEELPQALDALAKRETYGKAVIRVREEDPRAKL